VPSDSLNETSQEAGVNRAIDTFNSSIDGSSNASPVVGTLKKQQKVVPQLHKHKTQNSPNRSSFGN